MNIPSYKANVGQYNVPSMNASGEFNNASMIYEGVAKVCDTITDAGIKYYEAEKEKEAEMAGAEAVEKGEINKDNIGNLPTATTKAQKAYNDAAIDYYANSFNIENTKVLNELREKYKDNPAQYYIESEAYLKGASGNMPAHLKPKILHPLQVHSQANYNTILKAHSVKQQQIIDETTKFNLYSQADSLSNLDMTSKDDAVRLSVNFQKSAFDTSLIRGLQNGSITADEARKIKADGNKNMAVAWLSQRLDQAQTIEEKRNIRKMFMSTTGIPEIDTIPISDRFTISSFVAEKQSTAYKADAEMIQADNKAKKESFNIEFVNTAKYLAKNSAQMLPSEKEAAIQKLIELAPDETSIENVNKLASGGYDVTYSTAKEEIAKLKRSGNFNATTLTTIYQKGTLSTSDYLSEMDTITDAYTANTSTGAYKAVMDKADNFYKKKSQNGVFAHIDNEARNYFVQNMNDAMRYQNLSNDQIYKIGEDLMAESLEFTKQSSRDIYIAPVSKAKLEKMGINNDFIDDIASSAMREYSGERGTIKYSVDENFISKQVDTMRPDLSALNALYVKNIIGAAAKEKNSIKRQEGNQK